MSRIKNPIKNITKIKKCESVKKWAKNHPQQHNYNSRIWSRAKSGYYLRLPNKIQKMKEEYKLCAEWYEYRIKKLEADLVEYHNNHLTKRLD